MMQRCTECGKSHSVVPVLYGFPSPELISLRNKNQVYLGGDQMLEGAGFPHWQCTSCCAASIHYPWAKEAEPLEPVPEGTRNRHRYSM